MLTSTGAPVVTPVDGVIGVVCVGMSNARQQCDRFRQRAQTEWATEIAPAVRIANCAVGSHAIERWIDPAFDATLWRACIEQVLPAAGIRRDQVRVVHHKAANQFTLVNGVVAASYPAPDSDYARLQQHLDVFADRVSTWFPALQAVYTTTRSYGGFAPPHRGEPLSYQSGHAVNQWLRSNGRRGGVWHGWGAYLWALPCGSGVVTAVGLCYERSDFVADGVHPSPVGEAKTSTLMHQRFLAFSWYRR